VIAEVRGEGLMVGLRLHVPNVDLVKAAEQEELLVISAGDNVVRLLPPLIISDAEIAEAAARLDRACEALEAAMRQPAREAAA
jgi:acetylornithine/N-succinyldiaminopimelate aminotransferase